MEDGHKARDFFNLSFVHNFLVLGNFVSFKDINKIYFDPSFISQESISRLSADISTSTPVCPVVVGTPKTVSEWLKQVQQKSPQKSEQELSPDAKGVGMNCDSAKKKRKFIR